MTRNANLVSLVIFRTNRRKSSDNSYNPYNCQHYNPFQHSSLLSFSYALVYYMNVSPAQQWRRNSYMKVNLVNDGPVTFYRIAEMMCQHC